MKNLLKLHIKYCGNIIRIPAYEFHRIIIAAILAGMMIGILVGAVQWK